jgi:hemolysin III
MEPALSRDGSTHVTDEVINTATHLAAGCFALLGTILLVARALHQSKYLMAGAVLVYGLSLLSLFTFSTLHHGLNASDKVNRILRTFDYLSIFGLIGGTVTPVVVVLYPNLFGWSVLAVVWLIIALGVTLRATFSTLPKYFTSTLFIVLGWLPALLVVIGGNSLAPGGLFLLALGGALYTAGLVLFALEWPNPFPGKFGFHEVWHIMVVLAAFCHYMFMYFFVLPK